MNYNRRYVKYPRNTCTGAPPVRRAPAQFQRREPAASSSAWHGRQFQGAPSRYVQSQSSPVQPQAPSYPKSPMTFGTTPGYYHKGCWYNATLQGQEQQQEQQQQQPQQQHVPQYYMAEQEQHLPRSYQSEQVGSSAYPLQQQQQQQLSFQEYPQQQHQSYQPQQVRSSSYSLQQQQQLVILQSYSQEQHSYQAQQLMPSSGTSQPQFILLPAYPSQGDQSQQVILQAYPYQQPQQILPQSEQQQHITLPSYSHQQRARPLLRSQQYPRTPRVAPRAVAQHQAMPAAPLGQAPPLGQASLQGQVPLLSQAPLMSQVPLPSQAPTMESPRNQVAPVPATPEQVEAAQKPSDEVVEINLGPGIHATRSQNKITIDIAQSGVDIAVAEKRGDVVDLMNEALNLLRGFISRRRLSRRRRTRRRQRTTVKRVLVANKKTQTVDPWETDEELSSDDTDSVQVSPSTSRTLTQEEFLYAPQSVASSTRVVFDVEDLLSVVEGNDEGNPEQPENEATKPTQTEENSRHWKPKEAVTKPTTTIDDTCSWPPLGTRASTTKISLAQKNHSLTRTTDPRESSAYRGINKPSTFQPKQILQNPVRHAKDRAQSNEPGVSRVLAFSQALKAPPSRSLSSANEKMLLNSRQINMNNGGQAKGHSLRGLKPNKSDPMLIAGNMFALLEEPAAEPPSRLEKISKAAGKVEDHLDPQKLAKKRAKKQRKNFKRKERIRAARLEAQEKAAAEAEATPKAPAAADNNSGEDGKQCEVQFLGEIKVKSPPPIIPKPPQFLVIPNGGGDMAEETQPETKPAEEGDPPGKIPGEKEESPGLGARKGRRSQFLEAVAALKSTEEKEGEGEGEGRKRNLWEKRK